MEAREGSAILDELFRQELESHILIELQVFGAIDLAHSAASDKSNDAIAVRKQRSWKNASAFAAQR
jgi:hypothetical protein